MSKLRIVIFGIKYFPSRGGASRVVENLLWSLKDHFDFTIYCYRDPRAARYMPGVKVIEFPEIRIKGFGVFLYYLRCCLHLMRNGDYDLVHLHKTDAAFFLPLLETKFKVISTSHALPYRNDKWSWLGMLYFRIVERLFVRARGPITAIAGPLADYYSQRYGRPVHYIPNGIHPVTRVDPGLADELLREHQVRPDYLLFAARRVIPLKGGHTLIEALKQIRYQGSLVIAGDTEQLPSYTRQLKRAAAGLDVKFIGYVADRDLLNALVHRAGLFIFPSEIEGMSMMLLEVGSLGTPMVCSDIPQNKAVLGPEEVLFFQSQNAADLAEKLQYAFDHGDEMKTLSGRAREKIEREYSIDHIVQQYIDLYEETAHIQQQSLTL